MEGTRRSVLCSLFLKSWKWLKVRCKCYEKNIFNELYFESLETGLFCFSDLLWCICCFGYITRSVNGFFFLILKIYESHFSPLLAHTAGAFWNTKQLGVLLLPRTVTLSNLSPVAVKHLGRERKWGVRFLSDSVTISLREEWESSPWTLARKSSALTTTSTKNIDYPLGPYSWSCKDLHVYETLARWWQSCKRRPSEFP